MVFHSLRLLLKLEEVLVILQWVKFVLILQSLNKTAVNHSSLHPQRQIGLKTLCKPIKISCLLHRLKKPVRDLVMLPIKYNSIELA